MTATARRGRPDLWRRVSPFTLTRYVKALVGTEAGDAERMEAFLAATN